MAINIIMSDRQATEFVKQLKILPLKRQKLLTRRIGEYGRDESKRKVRLGGGVAPSKWIRAKKGTNKALEGVDQRIELFMLGNGKAIVETTDPRFSLGMHAAGYTKPAGSGGPADRVFGNWVILPLKNPSALNPPVSNPFMYDWTRHSTPSKVPARDILPTDADMGVEGNKIAQKWAQDIVSEALSKVGL